MADPRRLLWEAVERDDVKAVDQVLTNYPGVWGPSVADAVNPYDALDLALARSCEPCLQRLLHDPRSDPDDPGRLNVLTLNKRVDLIQRVLPYASPVELDHWLGNTIRFYRPDKYPEVRQIVALGLRRGGRLNGIKDASIFDGRYPSLWWAALQAGDATWASAPAVVAPLRRRRGRDLVRTSFPRQAYQLARARVDAAVRAAVGRNLAGYLWQAL